MKIVVKNRIKKLDIKISSIMSNETSSGMQASFYKNSNCHGFVELSDDELFELVANSSPYGEKHRKRFFIKLRDYVDHKYPPQN